MRRKIEKKFFVEVGENFTSFGGVLRGEKSYDGI